MGAVARLYARSGSAHLFHIVSAATEGCCVKITLCGHYLYPERTYCTRLVPERVCERCLKVAGG